MSITTTKGFKELGEKEGFQFTISRKLSQPLNIKKRTEQKRRNLLNVYYLDGFDVFILSKCVFLPLSLRYSGRKTKTSILVCGIYAKWVSHAQQYHYARNNIVTRVFLSKKMYSTLIRQFVFFIINSSNQRLRLLFS